MNTIDRGVVLRVSRGLYDHYGVYVGDNQIVHFTSHSSDKGADNFIMKTHMRMFIRDADRFDVMAFSEKKKRSMVEELLDDLKDSSLAFLIPTTLLMASAISSMHASKGLYNWFAKSDFHFYSKEECAKRAEKCLGFGEYSKFLNNCEQFAIWCKTGVHTSTQVNKIIDLGIEKSRTLKANDYVAL